MIGILVGLALVISGFGLMAGALTGSPVVGAAVAIVLSGVFMTLFALVTSKKEDE